MRARQASYTVVDFETTGSVRGFRDEPWQIGLVDVRSGVVCPKTAYGSLLNVGRRPFNPHVPGRHGQVREALRAAPALASLWCDLQSRLLGRPLVAHNAATERKMLADTFPLHRFGPWIDTLALARHAYPSLASHRLEEVIHQLGLVAAVDALCPNRTWHDALYDAVAAARLLQHLLNLPGWRSVSVEALQAPSPRMRRK